MKQLFKEDDLQAAQVTYLEARRATKRDLEYFAVSNEAVNKALGAAAATTNGKNKGVLFGVMNKLKKLGFRKGVNDVVVLLPEGRSLYVENKVKGRKQSKAQEAWEDALKALGHEYHLIVAETPGDAVTQLEELL